MQANFRGKHLITLREWTKEEIDTLMDVSFDLKRKFAMGISTRYLEDQTVFLMFFEASTRTRNSTFRTLLNTLKRKSSSRSTNGRISRLL